MTVMMTNESAAAAEGVEEKTAKKSACTRLPFESSSRFSRRVTEFCEYSEWEHVPRQPWGPYINDISTEKVRLLLKKQREVA